MNRNVLFLSYLFSPENAIGAVRMSKIAKYVSKNSNVVAICADKISRNDETLEKDTLSLDAIYRVMKAPVYEKMSAKISGKGKVQNSYGYLKAETNNSLKKRIYLFLRSAYSRIMTLIKDLEVCNSTKKFIKTNSSLLSNVDIMISSYGPKCNHEIALWVKKKYPNIKWIADFRDGMTYSLKDGIYKNYILRKEFRYVQNADAVTVVANGCISHDVEMVSKNKLYTVNNGFDFVDIKNNDITGYQDIENKVVFSYTGAIFTSDDRNASLLFKALSELVDEGVCTKEDFVIKYAGPDYLIFSQQAAGYGLEQSIINCGVVTRKEAIKIQLGSDILIHLTSYNQKGVDVLSGKLFEYMMMKKVIVSIVIGKYGMSSVKQIINDCNLGICCEEAMLETDYEQLKQYLKLKLDEKKIKGVILCNYDEDKVSQYDYRNISKQIESIMSILLEE